MIRNKKKKQSKNKNKIKKQKSKRNKKQKMIKKIKVKTNSVNLNLSKLIHSKVKVPCNKTTQEIKIIRKIEILRCRIIILHKISIMEPHANNQTCKDLNKISILIN